MLTLITRSSELDFDDFKDFAEGTQIALVCIIFLINATLIISKIACKGCAASFTAKDAIQISLAFSGIVSALFYNVVVTIIIFDMDNHGLNCMTTYAAYCYFFTFIPVVYCTGLILLAIDLLLRFKSEVYDTLGESKLYSFTCVILPWLVAFAVSCPLTLTEIAWDLKCAHKQNDLHLQAAIICTTFVPTCIVLCLAIGVAAVVRPRRFYNFQQSFDAPMYAISKVTTSSSSTDHDVDGNNGTVKHLNGSSNGKMSSPEPIPIVTTSDDNAYQSFTHTQKINYAREKCRLLFSMLFVAVIIIPYSCVFMYVTVEYSRMYTTLLFYMVEYDIFIAYQCTSYILNLYPIVIPLVWLCSGY